MGLYGRSPRWGSHFATVQHGGESRTPLHVCSPACGGELARCEAARWRSRTEGDAENSLSFVGSLSGSPLRPAAIAAVHLPQLSLGEDTLRGKVSHKPATEHRWGDLYAEALCRSRTGGLS